MYRFIYLYYFYFIYISKFFLLYILRIYVCTDEHFCCHRYASSMHNISIVKRKWDVDSLWIPHTPDTYTEFPNQKLYSSLHFVAQISVLPLFTYTSYPRFTRIASENLYFKSFSLGRKRKIVIHTSSYTWLRFQFLYASRSILIFQFQTYVSASIISRELRKSRKFHW